VQSERLGVDLNIAESGNGAPVHVDQPNHLASVGKLFTATLIATLFEQGKLDFTDTIGDYSNGITISTRQAVSWASS